MPTGHASANEARWRGAVAVLDRLRREPGSTRAALARDLGLASGTATEITARLRELDLVTETAAAASGRGRPTSVLGPHPAGPLVLVAEIRHEDWRVGVAGLDGRVAVLDADRHAHRPAAVLRAVAAVADGAVDRWGRRVRAVSVVVAATVRDGRLVQASTLGWGPVDLTALAPPRGLPLLVGNDATLAGVAEARSGAAAGAGTALHLTVEVGIGGTLVVDGRPVAGATGAGGEFGHLPFGDPALRCPCGARGCWDLEVDGRAVARHLGEPPPEDPRSHLRAALARPGARDAVERITRALGTGTAGLVNALDPEVVTLGGLAGPLRRHARAAFDAAFADGLMAFRRAAPPAVRDAVHGDDGALHGAAAVGLDEVISERGLAAWAADRAG
ncbi:ROK family transcriptional regulator [Pseudonocardia humida]|uniref:ROK family transcriptional regulator n=1 Tax=Pseudonocardia humida TaxID=2800819 RepID=A0ABT0ZTI6_9PSEU|nr:ROK family transcriptional regulator [Pseudonocardia humida]MCO1654036.1 ROK family transcriptional regulator [Pseudonocardia humida]